MMNWFWEFCVTLSSLGVASMISASSLLSPTTPLVPVNTVVPVAENKILAPTPANYTLALYVPEPTVEITNIPQTKISSSTDFVTGVQVKNSIDNRTYSILSHVYWLLAQKKDIKYQDTGAFVTNDFFQKQIDRVYDVINRNPVRGGSSVTSVTNNPYSTSTFSGTSTANISLGSFFISGDGDNEGLWIDNSGNVGIGTTTTTQALTIGGSIRIAGGLYDSSNVIGVGGSILQSTGSGLAWVATSSLGLGGSSGTVSSVGVSAPTGFSVAGSPVTTAGTIAISYTSGYEGLQTASSTNWNNFYNTPSSRIATGAGLNWTGNTLSLLTSGDWTGTFDGQEGTYYLDRGNQTGVQSTSTISGVFAVIAGGTGSTTPVGARANLGLGSLATLNNLNNSNWSGTPLSAGNGGTGTSTILQNALLIGGAGNTWTQIGTSSLGVSLTDTFGTLGVIRGGTGITAFATGDFIYASGVNSLSSRAIGSAGQVLQVVGNIPTWVATSSLGLGGSSGTVSSVGVSAPTGFSVAGSPVTTAGTIAISYTSGYEGLQTASSTNWNNFYNTPSTRITAGTNLAWNGNTLNLTATSTLGIVLSDTTGTLDGTRGGTGLATITQNQLLIGGVGNTWLQVATSSLGLSSLFTNSASLANLLTDESGTGSVAYTNSPTFLSPDLGTPTTLTLTNATGLQISTGVSGLAANVATFLGTPTSGNLRSALIDESGTGVAIFGTSPTFTTQLTSPKILGGNSSSSTLTLQSTSNGIPSTEAIIFLGGANRFGRLDGGSTRNVSFGVNSALSNTGTSSNIIGFQAAYFNSGSYNNIIGNKAGFINEGSDNNLFGQLTGFTNTGSNNNFFGLAAGYYNTGSYNNFIGFEAGLNLQATDTVAIGRATLSGAGQDSYMAINNTAIGSFAGYSATTSADNNILLGYGAAYNLGSGRNNIVIGYNSYLTATSTNNSLNIGNLIFGTGIDGQGYALSSGNIGIGTTTPNAKLAVAGTLSVTDTTTLTSLIVNGTLRDSAGNAGTAGMVLQTTGNGTFWVATSSLGLGGSSGTISSVALSAPLGFSVSGSPITSAGTLTLTYTAGYEGLLTASSTNWNNFYNTPSTRITAGTNLAWNGNTLNLTATSTLGIVLSDTTGTLDGTRGGTGLATITQNQLLIGGVGNTWLQVATSSLGLSSLFTNSSQLAGLLSDESGTGNVVYSDSPTFTGTALFTNTSNSGTLNIAGTSTFATTTQNGYITLGNNYINSDGGVTEGLTFDTAGRATFVSLNGGSTATTFKNLSSDIGAGVNLSFDFGTLTGAAILSNIEGASTASNMQFNTRFGGVVSERMRISSNGNIGIGTTSSSSLLTVAGTMNVIGTSTFAENVGIGTMTPSNKLDIWGNTVITTSSANAFAVGLNGTTFPAFKVDTSNASSTSGLSLTAGTGSAGPTLSVVSSLSSAGLKIITQSQGDLTLSTGGNTGVINIAPADTPRYTFSSTQATFAPANSPVAANVRFLVVNGSTGDTNLTASTEATFAYFNMANQVRTHSTGAITRQRDFRVTGSNHSFTATSTITDLAAFSIDLGNGGTNAIVTNSSGLYIPQSTVTNTVNGYGINISAPSGATNNYAAIFQNGNVGIGTSSPTSKLSVSGAIMSSDLLGGATTLSTDANGNIIRTPSDSKLKENVVTIENALDKVLALRGVSYDWKDKIRFGDQKEVGFLAQEVDSVVPEVVRKGGEYWSLNTPNLLALVVEAIKELWGKVQGIDTKVGQNSTAIDSLIQENESLKNRLNALEVKASVSNGVGSSGSNGGVPNGVTTPVIGQQETTYSGTSTSENILTNTQPEVVVSLPVELVETETESEDVVPAI